MPRWPEKTDVAVDPSQAAVDPAAPAVAVEAPAVPAKPGKLKFVAYAGKESLPNYIRIGSAKDGGKAPVRLAEPRFFVTRGDRKTYKVIAVYRTPHGVSRKLWAILKPSNKNRPKDLALFNQLKAAQIPGAF